MPRLWLQVTWHTAPETVVPCSAATVICQARYKDIKKVIVICQARYKDIKEFIVICQANPECEIALLYFNSNCRELFDGGQCTAACRNSAGILSRQKAAAKLATCTCDESGFLECAMIRESTRTFCFANETVQEKGGGDELNNDTKGMLNPQIIIILQKILLSTATILFFWTFQVCLRSFSWRWQFAYLSMAQPWGKFSRLLLMFDEKAVCNIIHTQLNRNKGIYRTMSCL